MGEEVGGEKSKSKGSPTFSIELKQIDALVFSTAGALVVVTVTINVYFVKYDVTVSFMAQVLDTVTYFDIFR